MGNTTANTGHPGEDEGEILVTIDPRGVILDMPEEANVASLLRARGIPGEPPAAPPRPLAHAHVPQPSLAPSFWHRLRSSGTKPAAD